MEIGETVKLKSGPRRSSIIRSSCRLFLGATSTEGQRFRIKDDCSRIRYINLLATIHQFVRAAVPLMRAAIDACRSQRHSYGDELIAYLEQHIPEEEQHEFWLLDDLETVGVRRDAVIALEPGPEVACLVGTHYYWIRHFSPLSILGYIGFEEGFHISEDAVRALQEATQLPDPAFRTILFHAENDVEHSDDLDRLIDKISITDAEFAFIKRSTIYTAGFHATVLRSVPDTPLLRIEGVGND